MLGTISEHISVFLESVVADFLLGRGLRFLQTKIVDLEGPLNLLSDNFLGTRYRLGRYF